ncbi:GH22010, partial [Drosophila grimshawi]
FFFTKGQRKSIKLNYGGHSFVKFMENSRGIKWICATRSTTRCRARVRTKDNSLEVLHGPHNHQKTCHERERAKQRRLTHLN